MDELDDYGLTLTAREVDLILDTLEHALFEEEHDGAGQTIRALMQKISKQTGVA